MHDHNPLQGLPPLPQLAFLNDLVPALWPRPGVEALWLEGSLARGNADRYSDVDLYVGVDPAALEEWRSLDVAALFGDHYAAHLFSYFADDFFVYHVYLTAAGIYDLHIQARTRTLPVVQRHLLAWRSADYRAALVAAQPGTDSDAAQLFAPQPFDPTQLPGLLNFFWINADKGRKVLYRNQDFTCYTGLHLLRQSTARLLFIEETGTDCGDLTRPSIHGLKATAAVLKARYGEGMGQWMGAPATTRRAIGTAQEILYDLVAQSGRVLADRYQVAYPAALEAVVRANWRQFWAEEE